MVISDSVGVTCSQGQATLSDLAVTCQARLPDYLTKNSMMLRQKIRFRIINKIAIIAPLSFYMHLTIMECESKPSSPSTILELFFSWRIDSKGKPSFLPFLEITIGANGGKIQI